ncbi:SURF1 family protein [Hydrogenophaga sp. MI9]|uniref:SURF1 family protein n=1 Tax=Hydrogenophaga sp. MI9 TaxID=3453719 RepID=UPI003EEE01FD
MTPRTRFWLVTAATAVASALTASMGVWQLSRADQKRTLEAQITQRSVLPPLDAAALLSAQDHEGQLHRRVVLRGRWMPAASVFLDNRPMAGHSGFILVTPLKLSGLPQAVLVQRGWVPRDFQDRNKVPEVVTTADDVEIEGRLAPPPSRLFDFGAVETGRIRQNLALDTVVRETGVPMPAVSVLQTGTSSEGLLREWPRFEADVHKHLGYAAQWFAMSALCVGLYAWFQLISPRRRRSSHGPDPR